MTRIANKNKRKGFSSIIVAIRDEKTQSLRKLENLVYRKMTQAAFSQLNANWLASLNPVTILEKPEIFSFQNVQITL